MGIVFRQSVKTSLVIFFGAFMGAIIVWLSTKFIEKQQLGFIGNLSNQAVVLSQILLLGLNNTLAVFIHRYIDNDDKRKLLLSFCLFLPLISMAVISIFYFVFKGWILGHYQLEDQPLMLRYYIWLPVFTLFFIYQVILEQYLGSQMKVAIAAFMREVVLRALNIILILAYAFNYVDFKVLVIGTVLIYSVPPLIFLLLAIQTEGFGVSFQLNGFTKTEYKEIIHFTWYHFLLTLSIILIGYMDVITLPLYDHAGFSSVAVYRVAVFIISFLQIPSKGMIPATFTVLAQAIATDDRVKAKDIFVRSSINILIATIGMALLIGCNLGNAIAVMAKGYEDILPIFLILFIGRFADLATGLNDAVISITNHYKFNFYLALVLIAVLYLLIRFLVPRYGVYGAAWSTTITYVLFNIAKYLFVWKKLDMQPFSSKSLLVIVAAIPAVAGGYFLPYLFVPTRHIYVHAFLDVVLRSGVIIVIYLGMLLWLKPSRDLQDYIASIKKNKRFF
jgi:O-antigen/teichoic acid export membrane protein